MDRKGDAMEITEETVGGVLVIAPSGRLDSNTSKTLEDCVLKHFAAGGPPTVMDLSGLVYVSSAGLRVLLMAAKRAKAGKRALALCGLSENIQEVFNMSGFGKLFQIYPARAEALAGIG